MQTVYSVSEINKYIKNIFAKDKILTNVLIKGEISNYKNHQSGHIYFSLKDQTSIIKCVMFRMSASQLKFVPESGMKVIINGSISVFERDGQYQLYAESMQPEGFGSLYLAFEQMKKRLSEEGLFDDSHKKKLPLLPKCVAIITSATGSVIRDILNVSARRFPEIPIKIYPVQVQGEGAAKQVACAIRKLNNLNIADVIIIARGGGSIEELWAFNEEIVARSIYESKIPIVSAIGHETDFTIADFVADLRAPTPSAAAELTFPEKDVLLYKLSTIKMRIKSSLVNNVNLSRRKLQALTSVSEFSKPYFLVSKEREKLEWLLHKKEKAFKEIYNHKAVEFSMLVGKLDALSPLKILNRGYSIVHKKDSNEIIKSVEQIVIGDKIDITFSKGKITAQVIEK